MTRAIEDALLDVEAAERRYAAGEVPYSAVELPKIALADVVRAAVTAQQAVRVRRLPARAVAAVVECEIRPKRRRQRA